MAELLKGTTTAIEVEARRMFVRALEEGRHLIASRPGPDGKLGDGSHKSLATELRISPARVGDFLRDKYSIEIGETDPTGEWRQFSPPRLRKAVAGFASSAERALAWLRREGLLKSDEIRTEILVKGYWSDQYRSQFEQGPVSAGIRDGCNAARLEFEHDDKIKVELWVVNWGPFGDAKEIEKRIGFFPQYGEDLVRAIDPINSETTPHSKLLSEILELPAYDRRKGLAIGMGPFATLHRQFRGFEFLTFPAVQFPVVGLLIGREKALRNEKKDLEFSEFLTAKFAADGIDRVVVTGDIGELVQRSVLSEVSQERKALISLSVETDVPEQLLKKTEDGRALAFLSDGMLAFETYVQLRRKNISVDVVFQALPEPDFSFSLGIMLRREDKDVMSLLDQAQKQIFKSGWRVRGHMKNFLSDVEQWLARQECKEKSEGWPDAAPIFLISQTALEEYIGRAVMDGRKARDIIQQVLDEVAQAKLATPALQRLLDVQPPSRRKGEES